jgi:hypothetical protein
LHALLFALIPPTLALPFNPFLPALPPSPSSISADLVRLSF